MTTYSRTVLLNRHIPIIDLRFIGDYLMQVDNAIDLANKKMQIVEHDKDAKILYEYDLQVLRTLMETVISNQEEILSKILKMAR